MTQTSTVLHSGGCLVVQDVRCGCVSGRRDEEETPGFELVVPLVGAFVRRSAQGEALVDPSFGYVAVAGGAQEITHVSDGDRCVALLPSPRVADAVGLGDGAASGVVPIDRRRQRLVAWALAAPPADPLAGEEAWLGSSRASRRRPVRGGPRLAPGPPAATPSGACARRSWTTPAAPGPSRRLPRSPATRRTT